VLHLRRRHPELHAPEAVPDDEHAVLRQRQGEDERDDHHGGSVAAPNAK
jgi:hypothetical protein